MHKGILLAIPLLCILILNSSANEITIGTQFGVVDCNAVDQSTGYVFGITVKSRLTRNLALQAEFSRARLGGVELSFGSREGSVFNTYTINALVGGFVSEYERLGYYVSLGIGYHTITRDYDLKRSGLCANIFVGLEWRLFDRFSIATDIGNYSRQYSGVYYARLGINYYIKKAVK